VPEVNARFEQLLHGDVSQKTSSLNCILCGFPARSGLIPFVRSRQSGREDFGPGSLLLIPPAGPRAASKNHFDDLKCGKTSDPAQKQNLALRELETLARTLLSVLLALFDPRITRYQSGLFQCRPQFVVVFNQRACDAVTNSPGLSRRTATSDVNNDIEFRRSLSQIQRLPNNHAQRLIREIGFERFSIDLHFAAARSQINSSSRSFPPPGSVVLNVCHVLNPLSYF
jgi:hypothetical protein